MVKTKHPLFSIDATGKLGKAIQFGHYKGRTVAGRRRNPKQPRTTAQRATRLFMSFLSSQWSTLSTAELTSWHDCPNPNHLALYHLFIKYNIDRYKRLPGQTSDLQAWDVFPTRAYPPAKILWAVVVHEHSITDQAGGFDHEIHLENLRGNWFIHWCIGPSVTTQLTYPGLVYIWPTTTTGVFTLKVRNIPAGFWYLSWHVVTKDGNPRPFTYDTTFTSLP